MTVVSRQDQQLNTIDRKVYNVSGDLMATTGSAADILQNIPSVDVDIDGNVSLRGDSSVQILIDGKSSAPWAMPAARTSSPSCPRTPSSASR